MEQIDVVVSHPKINTIINLIQCGAPTPRGIAMKTLLCNINII